MSFPPRRLHHRPSRPMPPCLRRPLPPGRPRTPSAHPSHTSRDMGMYSFRHVALGLLLMGGVVSALPAQQTGAVVWEIDNLKTIAGHPVTVVGSPQVVDA